jgi:phosphatidylglycerol:prolipoprotein diacylglycerol transferase
MLPILFRLHLSPAAAKAAVVLLAAALTLGRAGLRVWQARRAGQRLGLRAALWDDRWVVGAAAALAAGAWRAGLLDRPVSIPLNTYGLLLAAAFLAGAWLAQREARRVGQDPERVADLAFLVLLTGWLGSDLYYKAVNWRDFFLPGTFHTASPTAARILNALTLGLLDVERVPRFLLPAGMVFYGGFIVASLAAAWYLRRHRLPVLAYGDTLIASVAFGHFLGRLGCFSAGCCWGRASETGLPWLVSFPPASLAYQSLAGRPDAAAHLAPDGHATLPLHPTQLYESLGELGLFLLLVLWVRPRRRFEGQLLATWLLLYAVLRALVELFRGDVERGVAAGLAVGQWTSIAIFAAGVAVWVIGRRRSDHRGNPTLIAPPARR